MRAASYFIVFLIGLSTAANTQKGPVYQPPLSSGDPKSSHPTSIVQSVPSTPNNTPPVAEKRESPAFRQQEANPAAPNTDPNTLAQSYLVYYYGNPNAKTAQYHSQQPIHGSPGYSTSGTSVLSSATLKDWGTLVGSAALVGVGGFLAYSKFSTVKSRALRELQDMNAEDAARMAKGVMRALEKVYELSSSK